MYITADNLIKTRLIVDTHAHYDDERFSEYNESLFAELEQNGVNAIINNSVDLDGSADACLNLSNNYSLFYSAIGIHPQTVSSDFVLDKDKFHNILKNRRKIVAIGEIGLDYYWSDEHKDKQKEIFIEQIKIAAEYNLPVIIHDREAHSDTMEIINRFKPKGTVHCFSGSSEMAEEIIKNGMYIGVGGVVTFKNAKKLCRVVEVTPLDRILLETDAPYMAPEPLRGKTNLSAYLIFVARKIAEIKNVSVNEVLNTTAANATKLYNL